VSRLLLRAAVVRAAIVMASIAVVGGAAAGQDPEPLMHQCRRCLDGHRFLPSSIVADPFVTTAYQNDAGFGLAHNVAVNIRDADGAVVRTLRGDVGFLLINFQYQYAVTDWLGLRAGIAATGRTGTSMPAILAEGLSAAYGGSLGATARVFRARTTQVSLTGEYARVSDYLIDPYGFAAGVVNGGLNDSTRALLLTSQKNNRYLGGVRAAWTPWRWAGLMGLYEVGSTQTRNGNQTIANYGLLGDVDFKQFSSVPIGVALSGGGHTGIHSAQGISANTSNFTLGVHYTGRQTFTLGLEGAWARQRLNEDDVPKVSIGQGRFVVRLDF
jgi:hypothetical protein